MVLAPREGGRQPQGGDNRIAARFWPGEHMHPIAYALAATALLALAGCAGNRPAPDAPATTETTATESADVTNDGGEVQEEAAEQAVETETETDAGAEQHHDEDPVGGEHTEE